MNALNKISDYFVGSYRELRKITWPTKQQIINYSVLVIALSIGTAVFFSVLDYIFNYGFNLIVK